MTVKQTLRWIGGAIIAFLFAVLGIQQKKIGKQKEEIREQAAEIKTEKLSQENETLQAIFDYIAMMTEVVIPEEEEGEIINE